MADLRYPVGPIAWGRQIGFEHVVRVMGHLARAHGEDRYRTSLWLQHVVQATYPMGANRDLTAT